MCFSSKKTASAKTTKADTKSFSSPFSSPLPPTNQIISFALQKVLIIQKCHHCYCCTYLWWSAPRHLLSITNSENSHIMMIIIWKKNINLRNFDIVNNTVVVKHTIHTPFNDDENDPWWIEGIKQTKTIWVKKKILLFRPSSTTTVDLCKIQTHTSKYYQLY